VDGPAYMEFPLLGPQPEPPDLPFGGSNLKPQPTSGGPRPLIIGDCGLESRGYILVSLTEDDFPVVNYATAGPTRTECLRQRCGTSAARIVRYVGGFVAAEDQDGNLIGYLGDPPIRFASGILQYAGEQYEEYVTPQGSQNPPPPPVQFGPYASYDEFKKDYQDSVVYQEMRGRRKDAAKTDWDAELGREPEEILIPLGQDVTILENEKVSSVTFDNPDIVNFKILSVGIQMRGEKPGVTLMHVVFADQREADYVLGISEKNQSPQRPTGYVWTSWQYWYAECERVRRHRLGHALRILGHVGLSRRSVRGAGPDTGRPDRRLPDAFDEQRRRARLHLVHRAQDRDVLLRKSGRHQSLGYGWRDQMGRASWRCH
jgi:hypothetical protein